MLFPSVHFMPFSLTVCPQRCLKRGAIDVCCEFVASWVFFYYLLITTVPFKGKTPFRFKSLFQHLITPKVTVISLLFLTFLWFGKKYCLNENVNVISNAFWSPQSRFRHGHTVSFALRDELANWHGWCTSLSMEQTSNTFFSEDADDWTRAKKKKKYIKVICQMHRNYISVSFL